MSKLVAFFHIERSAAVRTFVTRFYYAYVCRHKRNEIADWFYVYIVNVFCSAARYGVVYFYVKRSVAT